MKISSSQSRPTALISSALAANVRSLLPSLSPAAARIANLVLEDPAGVARATIDELAHMAGTSQASVVRTARSLGFAGYPQLRLASAAAGARHEEATESRNRDIAPDDPTPAVIRKVAEAELEAIRNTANQLDSLQLESAAAAVRRARRLSVVGVWASGLVAMDLQQKLSRIGLDCHAYTDFHLAMGNAVLLTPEDVAIAVSYSGETVDVVEPCQRAAEAGATTIAITSHPRSSLARAADIVLVCGVRETAFRPGALASRISQLLVVDCLFIGVAQRMFPEAEDALRRTHAAVSDRRLVDSRRTSGPPIQPSWPIGTNQ